MPRKLIALGIMLVIGVATGIRSRAQAAEKLSLHERVVITSKIYRIVSTFFPRLSQQQFDTRYSEYVSRILKIDDRREFDLASMEFFR